MREMSTDKLRKSITDILKGADLDQLSAKKVRKMLEAKHKFDLTDRKAEIDSLVMDHITRNDFSSENKSSAEKCLSVGKSGKEKSAHTMIKSDDKVTMITEQKNMDSCVEKAVEIDIDCSEDGDDHDDDDDDVIEDRIPVNKVKRKSIGKRKAESSLEADDLTLAKQIYQDSRWRKCKAKPAARKDGKSKKGAKKGSSAYSRPCVLMPPLDRIMQTDAMPRHMVVKRLWEMTKERNLLDPKNKQFMLCDNEMKELFGKSRVRMFGILKLLKGHIKYIAKE